MKYTATITIQFKVDAETEVEALEKAQLKQEQLAGSNSGSEMLANAAITINKANDK